MTSLALLFLLVFVLNVIPAFAPPTWMAMSMFGFAYPDLHPWLVAVVAATAATCGRLLLAHMAQRIVRSRWAQGSTQENFATLADVIERRRAASAIAFLMFAFSPLPSNFLFIAYEPVLNRHLHRCALSSQSTTDCLFCLNASRGLWPCLHSSLTWALLSRWHRLLYRL